MKPLELRIYERHPSADAYKFGPSYTPTCLAVNEKRFTDAELAAELHRSWSVELAAAANHGGFKPGAMQRASIEVQVIHRFAALPHYDEGRS